MIRRALWAVMVLFLLLCGAVTVLLTTEWGLHFVMARAAAYIPGTLHYDRLSGRLAGPLRIAGLAYRGANNEVRIDTVVLDWEPLALVSGTLHVTRLDIEGVHYAQLRPSPTATGGGPPNVNLPLAVKINSLSVRDVSVARRGQSPIHVDEISLAANTDARGIHVTRLTVASPWLHATLHGTVQPRGAYAVELHSQWTSTLPRVAAVGGTLNVRGTLESLDISQHFEAPLRADVTVRVVDLLKKPRWSGHVVIHDLKTGALAPDLPPADVTADVRADGDLQGFAAQGRLGITARQLPAPVNARVDLVYQDAVLHVRELDLSSPHVPTRVRLEGSVSRRGDSMHADVTATWHQLVWPLKARGPYTAASAQGTARLQGTLDDYRLTLNAPLTGSRLPAGHWQAAAHGDQRALTVTKLHVNTLDGEISGSGTVAWSPRPSWKLALTGRGLNPGIQWPAFPGALSFNATTDGARGPQGVTVHLDVEQAAGRVRGNPVAAYASITYAGGRLVIRNARLSSGATRISASGSAGASWDMHWTVQSPDLGTVAPGISGTLTSTGHVTGELHRPKVDATVDGRRLTYDGYRLDRLEAKADVDLVPDHRSSLEVKGYHLKATGRTLDFIHVTGRGTLSQHRVEAALHNDAGVLSLELGGGYRDGQWTGQLRRFELINRKAGYWHLTRPVAVTAARNHFHLQRLCWVRSPALLCAQARWQKGGDWGGRLQAQRFQLQWLQAFLVHRLQLSGALNASLAVQRRAAGVTLQGDADVSGAAAEVALPDGTRATVKVTTGRFQAATRDQKIHATLSVALANGDSLEGKIAVPAPELNAGVGKERPPVPVTGSVTATLTDFELLPHFIPAVSNPSGRMTATVAVGGTLSEPTFSGKIDLENGAVDLPAYGVRLTQVIAHAKSGDGSTFEMYGSAHSGGGTAQFSATGRLPFAGPESVSLTLTSDRFEAVKIPEAWALITSDITLHITATAIDFTGNVFVPEAKLKPPDLSGTVRTSNDVVVVNGRQPPAAAKGRTLSGIIEIRFGDKVQFEGFGLKARVTGDVAVREEPKQPTLGYGSLDVTGVYKAYGQDLTITRGRLTYVGSPIDNPGVDIRAERVVNDVTAGINVSGTIKQPRFSIYSSPPMDQTDALSYLLLGRPVNQASTQQGKQLASAALSLGLTGGEFIAKQLGRMFGIETVEVQTSPTTGNPSLVLGTYLRPDLYLSYGFDIVEHINILRLQYQISKQWALDAESGLYSGADILYTIETH